MTQLPPHFPLAELHCHIEATVTPSEARLLAKRHGIDLSGIFTEAGDYAWSTFAEFLSAYDAMTEVIRTPEDYRELTLDYLRRQAADGVIYQELFISVDHPARVGMAYPDFRAGVVAAIEEAEAEIGIVARLILTGIRHYGVTSVEATARLAEKFPHPLVTGFGMAGDENFGRPADFSRAFDIARGAGLSLTVHAGEVAGPESVRAALDGLRPARIGHGVRAIEDPDLTRRLKEEGIVLEVCPASNLALGLYADAVHHPLPVLLAAGVPVTLSSDDPAFFGASVRDEYQAAARIHRFSLADLLATTRRAIGAAFCEPAVRARLLGTLGHNSGP